ncbi:MAG TPA: glucose-6-phosphate dehydrogenase [Niabella sp.]|nr:glucose-6-phosphate dehydrogenase [Niabella sp.]HOZ96206.1 glucose-6-phosphate dehydrogenase [Niabella sp.]HQW13571.1 glucose-6-phosphate dehydrogenase [Niabella sp.]HQX18965.1 glucose-6-phosphate dehydrogenase [Niabella sp.]HQX40470.1 glucose-6-phosphate dehydrogenase [Niabella sp.]
MSIKNSPANIVIFGGFGDLAWRKLIPAFYNLYIGGFMPEKFAIYAVHYQGMPENVYEKHMLEGVNLFSRSGKAKSADWKKFVQHLYFIQGDFTIEDTYTRLKKLLVENDQQWKIRATRLLYYSVAPTFIEVISTNVSKHGIADNREKDRLVVEKPFGTDLASAKALNELLNKLFYENQVYRIDHYLGKEVVQNIIAFRFANHIFEPLWNNKYIDHIQISVTETVSVGTRGGYYDKSGALRDMVQNHLMQLLSLVSMDCPGNYDAESIRQQKVKVLKKVRPFNDAGVAQQVVRAQYSKGVVNGSSQVGYKNETNVAKKSHTETYVALKMFIDNPRWRGVPFYLRTGKCLNKQASTIVIQFKDSPYKIFKDDTVPNRLTISIQPRQEIRLLFEGKIPGLEMKLKPLEMDFSYKESFKEEAPEAYETLLLDALEGDATQFIRADQVETAWSIVMPILDNWSKNFEDMKTYKAGSWGPKEADDLMDDRKGSWLVLPENEKWMNQKLKKQKET